MVYLGLLALVVGFLVALLGGAAAGRERAHSRPGGSLGAGLCVGAGLDLFNDMQGPALVAVLIGAACGFAGWCLYCLLFPLRKEK